MNEHNNNYITREVVAIIQEGKIRYYGVANILRSRSLSRELKMQLYDPLIYTISCTEWKFGR